LAGISSETNTGVQGLEKAVIGNTPLDQEQEASAPDLETLDLLEEAAEPLEGPDRTNLTEFYSDDVLEEDPTLHDRTEDSDMPLEEELTIHGADEEM